MPLYDVENPMTRAIHGISAAESAYSKMMKKQPVPEQTAGGALMSGAGGALMGAQAGSLLGASAGTAATATAAAVPATTALGLGMAGWTGLGAAIGIGAYLLS